jgi:PAS domain S-box-containing protein
MDDLAQRAEHGDANGRLLNDLREGLQELRVAEDELRRKEAELDAVRNALARDREHYGELFEFAPIAYLVTDPNGLILDANNPAGELLELPDRHLIGKPLANFVRREDRRTFRRLLLLLGEEPGVHELELVLVARTGTPFDAELTVVAGDVGLTTDELRFTIRDIRARKAAETELRTLNDELELRVAERAADAERQRAWLAGIVAQIPVAMIVAEAPSGRVVLANDEVARITRRPTPTLQSIADYRNVVGFHPHGDALEPEEWPLARATRGETVQGEVIELERGDGTRTLIESSAAPIRDQHGSVVAAVALFHDVSERDRRESAEREFVANAAHELQTPVAAISNAVEALQSGAKDDPDQRDRFLAHLQRDVERLGRLSNSLLVLARAERGGELPRLELMALEPLLADAATATLPASGVDVVVDCADDVGVLTHPDLLAHVLGNIAANSARHTMRGRITFTARLIGRARVSIEISDTGAGIPPEQHEHVFRRFYRGDAESGGSGLGLAIAQQAMNALGGRLKLESAPGIGTTVSMTLPGARLVR